MAPLDRRGFFRTAGAGLGAAGLMLAREGEAAQRQWSEKDKLARIASCSYPIRYIFKTRPGGGRGRRPWSAGRGRARESGDGGSSPQSACRRRTREAPGQGNGGMTNAQMKEKYGEITMLDFPQFTKDTFPGVTHMDLFSGLFGDVTDDSMFAGRQFDPSTTSGKKWLDQLATNMAAHRRQMPAHLEQRAHQPCRS